MTYHLASLVTKSNRARPAKIQVVVFQSTDVGLSLFMAIKKYLKKYVSFDALCVGHFLFAIKLC